MLWERGVSLEATLRNSLMADTSMMGGEKVLHVHLSVYSSTQVYLSIHPLHWHLIFCFVLNREKVKIGGDTAQNDTKLPKNYGLLRTLKLHKRGVQRYITPFFLVGWTDEKGSQNGTT